MRDIHVQMNNDKSNAEQYMGKHALNEATNANGNRILGLCAYHKLFIEGTKFPHLVSMNIQMDTPYSLFSITN